METVVEWLNDNTGFVMAVLTAIYVVATILIVLESRRTNRLTSIWEDERNRPNVIVWIDAKLNTRNAYSSDIDFYLYVRNDGSRTAHEVSIHSDPELATRHGFDSDGNSIIRVPSLIKESISILVPAQTVSEDIGPTKYFYEDRDDAALKITFEVKYKDSDDKTYSESYAIDLSAQRGYMFSEDARSRTMFQVAENILEISRSLADIQRTLDQPDRGNLFVPLSDQSLNGSQKLILEKIVESEKDPNSLGSLWMLVKAIGSTKVRELRDGGVEFEVQGHDVEALCQEGSLAGYYQGGTLFFRLSSRLLEGEG